MFPDIFIIHNHYIKLHFIVTLYKEKQLKTDFKGKTPLPRDIMTCHVGIYLMFRYQIFHKVKVHALTNLC